eukprot:gene11929-13504_t
MLYDAFVLRKIEQLSPKALLFIDILHLKYLFQGAVGKDLLDDTLSEDLESLDDIVLLVKESSVSIIYSTLHKLFEVQDLKVASQATVFSRCAGIMVHVVGTNHGESPCRAEKHVKTLSAFLEGHLEAALDVLHDGRTPYGPLSHRLYVPDLGVGGHVYLQPIQGVIVEKDEDEDDAQEEGGSVGEKQVWGDGDDADADQILDPSDRSFRMVIVGIVLEALQVLFLSLMSFYRFHIFRLANVECIMIVDIRLQLSSVTSTTILLIIPAFCFEMTFYSSCQHRLALQKMSQQKHELTHFLWKDLKLPVQHGKQILEEARQDVLLSMKKLSEEEGGTKARGDIAGEQGEGSQLLPALSSLMDGKMNTITTI